MVMPNLCNFPTHKWMLCKHWLFSFGERRSVWIAQAEVNHKPLNSVSQVAGKCVLQPQARFQHTIDREWLLEEETQAPWTHCFVKQEVCSHLSHTIDHRQCSEITYWLHLPHSQGMCVQEKLSCSSQILQQRKWLHNYLARTKKKDGVQSWKEH